MDNQKELFVAGDIVNFSSKFEYIFSPNLNGGHEISYRKNAGGVWIFLGTEFESRKNENVPKFLDEHSIVFYLVKVKKVKGFSFLPTFTDAKYGPEKWQNKYFCKK